MNGIYLHFIIKEIKPRLLNQFIHRISIKEKLVQIEFDDDALFVSLFPQAPGIYINKKVANFIKLSFFDEHLSKSRITSVEQLDFCPVVVFTTERIEYGQRKIKKIKVSLYKEAPNLTLISEGIQKSLLGRYIEKEPKPSIFEIGIDDLQNPEILPRKFEGIDKYLARELNTENLENLKKFLAGEKAKPRLISILPLRFSLFAKEYLKEYESWNDLVADGVLKFFEERERFLKQRALNARIKKLNKKLERLKRFMIETERIEEYRITGELLLANASNIPRGISLVKLFNPYTQKEIEVKLDPKKSVQENAREYFKKYKKVKRGLPKLHEKVKEIEEKIHKLKAGEEIIQEKGEETKLLFSEKEKASPFREFALKSGSKVYVGKNAKSNLMLTFKFARPDDYFFHIRGYKGAHTILRPKLQKGKNPQQEDIETAAAIAAYYSKAKGQRNVPVSYTQRKYLKKSKKGKLGSVILMREEVIFVDPGLPEI
uniref:DUF814 domain-containing protein n=1 Tax=candidate division WOR-3 bacterium TaxID=2052148 RepID=A0A7C4TBS7_UNCW3